MPQFMDITKDNVYMYCRFDKNFQEDLEKFQSRIYPNNSDLFTVLIKDGLLKWSYIIQEGVPIGAIWLEKEHRCVPTALLGIFIAHKEKRCKGIGERAIKEYINLNKGEMNLQRVILNVRKENIRAIKCYEKCGFTTEKEYEKKQRNKNADNEQIIITPIDIYNKRRI